MKMTTLAAGTGAPAGAEIGNGRTASPQKMAAAKAIAAGISVTQSDTPVDAQVERAQQSIRKIKMKTNFSTDRIEAPSEPEPVAAADSATPDAAEQAQVPEETKPLSPQFAALARQKRALQVKERELADREKALASAQPGTGGEEILAKLKSDPLGVLQEAGVTYDQLTEAVLSNPQNKEISQLREELKALKEGVDKNLSDRDANTEKQVLQAIKREADLLSSQGDEYELVRATGSQQHVVELIHRTFKQTGEVMDTTEALGLIENELVNDYAKLANLKKIQSKLAPAPTQQLPEKQMRTLTNRDGATPSTDRRQRAIAAFYGK